MLATATSAEKVTAAFTEQRADVGCISSGKASLILTGSWLANTLRPLALCTRARAADVVLPIFIGGAYAMQSVIETIASSKRALTAAELANLLAVSPDQIYALARKGVLPSFRVGNAVRFDPKAVVKFLDPA